MIKLDFPVKFLFWKGWWEVGHNINQFRVCSTQPCILLLGLYLISGIPVHAAALQRSGCRVLNRQTSNLSAGLWWDGFIRPESLIQVALLSFTSWSPTIPALTFVIRCFCTPVRVMKSIWLLSCARQSHLGPLLVSWDTSLLIDHFSWHQLLLKPNELRLGGGGKAGWI